MKQFCNPTCFRKIFNFIPTDRIGESKCFLMPVHYPKQLNPSALKRNVIGLLLDACIKEFKSKAKDSNIVTTLTHAADATDFAQTARTIRDSKADAVFAWTYDAQMQSLLKALTEVGWKGEIVYQGLDSEFVQKAGAAQAANVS